MSQPSAATSTSQQRVRAALAELGLADAAVREFPERTATASEAAAEIGTSVEHIVKSLVFLAGGEPVLVLVGGSERVDVDKLSVYLGRPITRANADVVRSATGFAIGGVPPIGHTTSLLTVVDRLLLSRGEVWAAAGTPNSVFGIEADRLAQICDAQVADISQTD